jgi:hypothetical protein
LKEEGVSDLTGIMAFSKENKVAWGLDWGVFTHQAIAASINLHGSDHSIYSGAAITVYSKEVNIFPPRDYNRLIYEKHSDFYGIDVQQFPRKSSEVLTNTYFNDFLRRQIYLAAQLLNEAGGDGFARAIFHTDTIYLFPQWSGTLSEFVSKYKDQFSPAMTTPAALKVDKASISKGGIDLKASDLKMDIQKQGAGVDMDFDPAMSAKIEDFGEISPSQMLGGMEQFKNDNFKGLEPVIIKITPINGAWTSLGLAQPQEPTQLAGV